MDVKVEAGVLTAGAVLVESTTTVESLSGDFSPVVFSLSFTPSIISISGHSISSINPEFTLIGDKAAA